MANPKVKTTVRYYKMKNKLREKTAGLGKLNPEDVQFDTAVLEAAMQTLNDMSEEYPDWVSSLIAKLADEHRRCVDSPEERRDHFRQINTIAHDMKGQGGTFGYELISVFSDGLYEFTRLGAGMSDNHVEIIKSHIDSMRVVIKDRINGDGGEIGMELKRSLEAAIEKYSTKE
jgi:hypothetical protein